MIYPVFDTYASAADLHMEPVLRLCISGAAALIFCLPYAARIGIFIGSFCIFTILVHILCNFILYGSAC